MPDLFSPLPLGPITLPNRVLMAPLTRCRAGPGFVPTAMMAEYYRQRASAGLIISEATPVCPEGHGYPDTPGIYTDEQVAGWRTVTQAVHDAGGRIFLQLWHVGRVSHPDFQPGGALPVAPSAVMLAGEVRTPQGRKQRVMPRALELREIPKVVEQFRDGASRALDAGFDGVEIHGANGYIIDQFLKSSSNARTDEYGGSIANRARFLFDVIDAVHGVWGPGRVGLRLSPSGNTNGQLDSDPLTTFSYVVKRLNDYPLAYAHIMRAQDEDPRKRTVDIPIQTFRDLYNGVIVTNGRMTREVAGDFIARGEADAVAFGKAFIANPDLPERLRRGAALNKPDPATFYSSDAAGYIDYPALAPA